MKTVAGASSHRKHRPVINCGSDARQSVAIPPSGDGSYINCGDSAVWRRQLHQLLTTVATRTRHDEVSAKRTMTGATTQTTADDTTDVNVAKRRLVLLGASNLARGIATVVQTARTTLDGPLDLMAALGHGRSYGRGAWVLGRWLPGIIDCHLWEDLTARDDDLPTDAVVTDVGNDILYGASTEEIIGWVETCIIRLRECNCRIVLTGIPLGSLQRMGWEFPLFRTIFYPGCKLTRDDSLKRATELAEALKQLACDHDVHFVDPDSHWYGIDRIHISRGSQALAWQAFMAALGDAEKGDVGGDGGGTLSEFIAIRRLTPYHRRVFGYAQHCEQPAGRLRDGTRVSLY